MIKLFLFMMLVSGSVFAQEACFTEEKPHYFVATGTAKTVGVGGLRTFGIVSPNHNDMAACNEALDMLRAQTGIAGGNGIATQLLSYEGFCIAAEVCP